MSTLPNVPEAHAFADVLRERTAHLHRRAERSGIVADIIVGQITRAGYALFLRNLLPAYHALELALESHRNAPGMSGLCRADVFRAPAIVADLYFFVGDDNARLPLLPEATRYAERIALAASEAPGLLIAHAYTRYMGDLGGGQILEQLLRSTLHLDDNGLAFYSFPSAASPRTLATAYRSAIDSAAECCSDLDRVADEAVVAFQLNIELSEAIRAFLHANAQGS